MAIPLLELPGGRNPGSPGERAGGHSQREPREERNSQGLTAIAGASALRLPPMPSASESAARAPAAVEAEPLRTLEVVGAGEARVQPDRALLSLAVDTRALTARQGASENGELVRKVIQALGAELDGGSRVWAGACSLRPQVEHPRGHERPLVIGYHAANSVNVETAALDKLGPLIDIALAAGASRVNCLDFSSVEDVQARGVAIQRACRDAQAQADALIRSLAIRLERIVKVTTKAGKLPGHAVAEETEAALSAAETLFGLLAKPGEITIAATVSIIYQIE